jgi:acylphosphatase
MAYCRRCIVSGKVQGVFFRDTTRGKARLLGVHGYAKNLQDGTVEVLACGDEQAVNALCEWLWEGSRYAKVSNVECKQASGTYETGFYTA